MSTASALLLFFTMTMLAAAPGAGNALVVSRSVSLGIGNGIATAAGIVTGDLIFIAIAATGISAVAEIDGLARPLHLVAAGYLLWLGIDQPTATPGNGPPPVRRARAGLGISYLSGLLLTLVDVKAILFYSSLLPLYLRDDAASTATFIGFAAIALLSVGGVKLGYALTAGHLTARRHFSAGVKRLSGWLLIVAALVLLWRGLA